jgi:hypothetical protein
MSEHNIKADDDEEMLPEYDLTGGIRGKYADRYCKGSNVVLVGRLLDYVAWNINLGGGET